MFAEDYILLPVRFDDVVLMAQNINPASGKSLRDEFEAVLTERMEDAMADFESHYDEIMTMAFPDTALSRDPDWDDERCEALAQEIYKFLLEHDMWIDVSIYYNGKRMSTSDGNNFRYNGPPFIEEDKNPKDYFEYVNDEHILSMSFEGPLYDALNGYDGWDGLDIEERFSNLLSKHGLYYELGNAWNLTLYKI